MNFQTIKSIDGQEYMLLPRHIYNNLKSQIDACLVDEREEDPEEEYIPFILENYIENPVSLARIKAGVTQQELAKLMRVSQSYISKIEHKAEISTYVLSKVKKALDKMRK